MAPTNLPIFPGSSHCSRLRNPKRSPTIPNEGFFSAGGQSPTDAYGQQTQQQVAQSGNAQSDGHKPLYLCQPFVKAALVKGSFKTIVAPPKYVDVNEWVAINSKWCPDITSSTHRDLSEYRRHRADQK